MDVQEAPTVSVQTLCDTLDTFVNSNSYAGDEPIRWLANHLTDTLALVQRVRNGALTAEDRKLILSFRLSLFQSRKTDAQKQIEQIDREVKSTERELFALSPARGEIVDDLTKNAVT